MGEAAFHGWPRAAIEFFEGLERDNSKSYWLAQRAVYERDVKAPMLALLADLSDEFGEARLFRPHRDVRFSPDKTPYKTSIAAMIGTGYVGLSARGLEVGAGYHQMSARQLERYRVAVAAEASGARLELVVGELRARHLEVRSFFALKTAPRGYPKDHARIEWLRYKGIVAMQSWPPGPWLASVEAERRVEEFLHAASPLVDWLTTFVGVDEGS